MFPQAVGEVLDHDHGGVDQEADGDGEAAQGHRVEAQPSACRGIAAPSVASGSTARTTSGAADVPEEEHKDERHEEPAQQQRLGHAVQGVGDELPWSYMRVSSIPSGRPGSSSRASRTRATARVAAVGLLHDPQAHVLVALVAGKAAAEGGALAHLGDFAEQDRAPRGLQPERCTASGPAARLPTVTNHPLSWISRTPAAKS